MKEPLLSVCLITYNQVDYVQECLDGIMSQDTRFPFEVLVHDDASTDGTQDIINEYAKQYPDIIKPILQKENQYSQGVKIDVEYNFKRAKGKYIATCEGDDFWTDPRKLQMQVDVMEAHPEYTLCCHRASVMDSRSNTITDTLLLSEDEEGMEFDYEKKISLGWFFHTLSVVFRNHILDTEKWKDFKYYRDVHQFFYLLKNGKGYYINRNMGTYRDNPNGIYRGLNRGQQIHTDLNVFNEFYSIEKDPLIKRELIGQLEELAFFCIRKHEPLQFFKFARTMRPKVGMGMYADTLKRIGKYYILHREQKQHKQQ